jgi:hypothetical protein
MPVTPSYVKDYWLFSQEAQEPETCEDPEPTEDALEQEGPRPSRPRKENLKPELLENLKANLQQHMHQKHRLGRSNQESASTSGKTSNPKPTRRLATRS